MYQTSDRLVRKAYGLAGISCCSSQISSISFKETFQDNPAAALIVVYYYDDPKENKQQLDNIGGQKFFVGDSGKIRYTTATTQSRKGGNLVGLYFLNNLPNSEIQIVSPLIYAKYRETEIANRLKTQATQQIGEQPIGHGKMNRSVPHSHPGQT